MRSVALLAVVLLAVAPGCARPAIYAQLPAPDPSGCYVMVFERAEFRGVGDVWNGPGQWATLEELSKTRAKGWRNQIRSLRVGATATVKVFTDPGFGGDSREFPAQTELPQLDQVFSGRIESLQLSCR